MTADVKDLVERLALSPGDIGGPSYMQMMREREEAASLIEAQMEEIFRLRKALTPFVEWVDEIDTSPGDYAWRDEQSILRGLKMGSFRRARATLNHEVEQG
jgi:hypothetical protein